MFPPSKPSDVKQDSTEQFKTKVTCFQPKLNSSQSPIQMGADWCVKICFLKIASNLTFYGKQNNGNLNVLKQDGNYRI